MQRHGQGRQVSLVAQLLELSAQLLDLALNLIQPRLHGKDVLDLGGASHENAVLRLGRPEVLQARLQVDHGCGDILLVGRLDQDFATDLVEPGQGIVEARRRNTQHDGRGLVERAGLSTLNEGQQVDYEIVSDRGKESAGNLKVK